MRRDKALEQRIGVEVERVRLQEAAAATPGLSSGQMFATATESQPVNGTVVAASVEFLAQPRHILSSAQ